ncbi:hypothetical protein OG304_06710 [Streptomyces sp. NBC_00160]|uniref:hypothetical protein n=1 Tax=Streptomyces sp. NBC_00160 TaxID=2903628 RepID=UPI00225367D6|nr:hypothetical protein [Streptomyces sp. NBC_00160]MCX5303143.1 hypothetical protein [Streptomyces sp. NBC_00160]
MNTAPRYGLSFDPRALNDLLAAPGDIRDLALAHIQDAVNGVRQGNKLTGDLSGFRKTYVDHRAEWRMVYALRAAPASATHTTEVYVVAVRPRDGYDVYDTVATRLGLERRPLSALAHAARSRSPHTTVHATSPVPVPATRPGIPQPAPIVPSTRGITR